MERQQCSTPAHNPCTHPAAGGRTGFRNFARPSTRPAAGVRRGVRTEDRPAPRPRWHLWARHCLATTVGTNSGGDGRPKRRMESA
eukprot:3195940-Alexandrium_andersonii.AAC.1